MKPTKALFIACLFLVTLAACSCSVRQVLGSRMNQYIKSTKSNVWTLVSGIKTFTHDQSVTLKASEIGTMAGNVLNYNMDNGAYLSTARGLRRRVVRRRVFHRRGIMHNALIFRGRRPVYRRSVKVVRAAPVRHIAFRPFEGLKDLKFGKDYKRVLVEQSIRSPGQSWGKITAMEGVRKGKDIEYTAAYGWATGNGLQQYNHNKVRKCKRILFWKKCKNVWVKIPRGLFPDEIQQVERALHNPILEQLRNKLSSGRLLSAIQNTQAWRMPKGMNQVQVLTSVSRMNAGAAIKSLIGSSLPFSRRLISRERSLTIIDEHGNKHLVEQTFRGSKVNLKVFSSI